MSPRHGRRQANTLLVRQPVDGEPDVAALRRAWQTLAAPGLDQVDLGVTSWLENDDEICERVGERLADQPFEGGTQPPAVMLLVRTPHHAELQLSAAHHSIDPQAATRLLAELAAAWPTFVGDPVPSSGVRAPSTSDSTDEAAVAARVTAGPDAAGADPADSLILLDDGAGDHLHLFHPGGGGVIGYMDLLTGLPADWRITASDDIGMADSVEALVEIYLPELVRTYGVPRLMGGWSLGGLLALQAARWLADRRAPYLPDVVILDPPRYGRQAVLPEPSMVNREFAGMLWTNNRITQYIPVELDTGEDPRGAVAAIRAGLSMVGAVEDNSLLSRLRTFRRHRSAITHYDGAGPVPADVLLVAAALPEAEAAVWGKDDLRSVEVRRVACGHHDVLRRPYVEQVAAHIVAWRRSRLTAAKGSFHE